MCRIGADVCASGAERRISVADYRDRMEAAWIGQVAGVAWGAPTEFRFNWKIIPADAKEQIGSELIDTGTPSKARHGLLAEKS